MKKYILLLLISIVLVLLADYLIASILPMHPIASHTNTTFQSFIAYAIDNLDDIIKYVINAMANSLVEKSAVRYMFPDNWKVVHNAIGVFILVLSFSTLFLLSKVKKPISRDSFLAFVLLLMGGMAVCSTMYYRIEMGGSDYAYSGRYVRYFQLGLLGIFFLSIDVVKRVPNCGGRPVFLNIFRIMIVVLMFSGVASAVIMNIYKAYYVNVYKNNNDKIRDALIGYEKGDPVTLNGEALSPATMLETLNKLGFIGLGKPRYIL